MLGDHIRALKGDRWLHGIDLGDQRVLFLDETPGLPPADRLRRVYRPEFTAGAGRVETVVHREPVYPAKAVVARAWSRFMDPSALAAVTTSQQFAEWCKVGRAPAVAAMPAQPQPAPSAPAPVGAPAPAVKPAAPPAPKAAPEPSPKAKPKAKAAVKAKAVPKAKASAVVKAKGKVVAKGKVAPKKAARPVAKKAPKKAVRPAARKAARKPAPKKKARR